jgi:hypothetical protein
VVLATGGGGKGVMARTPPFLFQEVGDEKQETGGSGMMQEEFEKIAGAEITGPLYESIELRYVNSNEDKFEFIGRIFGNKNTPKTIAIKYAQYLIRNNRNALKGTAPERLREMDECIIDYVTRLTKFDYVWGRLITQDVDLFNARLNGKRAFVWEEA